MELRVRRLTRLSLLVAVGLILNLVERQLPALVPVPGVRLGLANMATLLALGLDGPAGALWVWALRFGLAGLLSGSLLGPAFLVGGVGGLMAWAAMAGGDWLSRNRKMPLSAVGISVGGALAHHVGQLAMASVVTLTPSVFYLLPPLLALGIPVGVVNGVLAGTLLRRLVPERAVAWVRRLRGWLGGDVFLVVLAVVVALALSHPGARGLALRGGSDVGEVEVIQSGQTLMHLDLADSGTYPVPGTSMLIQVEDGAVRVVESDCPDQVCVLTGWIREAGDLIVCAPNRIVVRISGSTLKAPDAILR